MNAIRILATQPWVERLGLTLLHFLWQGAVLAAIYAAARKFGWRLATRRDTPIGLSSAPECGPRSSSPNGRYLLACTALTAMALAPVATWILLRTPAPGSAAITFAAPMSAAVGEPAGRISRSLSIDVYTAV